MKGIQISRETIDNSIVLVSPCVSQKCLAWCPRPPPGAERRPGQGHHAKHFRDTQGETSTIVNCLLRYLYSFHLKMFAG